MNSDKTKKVALVTGSSSGIGFEISLTLARNGFFTYATMRNLDKSKNIVALAEPEKLPLEVVQLDINDDWSIRNVIDKIADKQCAVDVLVNNAGYALVGPVEELSVQEFKEQFETNVFGVVRVIQEILPTMRMRKSGIIVNISSINGRVGFPLTSAYVSSKFALEGLSESLAYELEQFGINVILIEPGIIKSNFINNLKIGKNVYTGDGKSP
jgi:NAD(P)-dependent dehydrogenase (short-subunit alcohol dehydrogenase family)